MSKELKYRAVCPICGKGFDTRYEGMKDSNGYIVCPECYRRTTQYKTIKK